MEAIYRESDSIDAMLENFVPNGDAVKGMMIRGQGSGYAVRLVLDTQQFMRTAQQ